MTFSLVGIPKELQPIVGQAVEERNNALTVATAKTKSSIKLLLLDIASSLGTGAFEQSEELTLKIEEAKTTLAGSIDTIIQAGTLEVAGAAMGIGAKVLSDYLLKQKEDATAIFPVFKNRVSNFAERYRADTTRVYAPGTGWKLSERIWNLADDNLENIQKILQAGEGTDAVKLAKSLRTYIREGRETFAEQYPEMFDRMGGRVAKNTSYEALRLTRNELSEAYWQASVEGYKNNDAIYGVRMILSNNRPAGFKDICDTMVQEDLYGLGRGCYPIEYAPAKPHIQCLCTLIPLVRKGGAT